MPLPRFSTSHKRHQKSHFIQKFRGKMPGPRSRGRGHTFDASLRSRNALQHFTRDIRRATLSEIYKKKAPAQIEPRTRGHTLCASLRSRNACPHVTRDIRRAKPLYRKFTGKMPRPRLSPECGRTLCASLPSRNACQDFRRATLSWNLQEKCRAPECAQNADEHFVRACSVETHVKISQEPLYTEICRKNAAAQSEHPDQPPAFSLTVRTPSVWTLGEKEAKSRKNGRITCRKYETMCDACW